MSEMKKDWKKLAFRRKVPWDAAKTHRYNVPSMYGSVDGWMVLVLVLDGAVDG